ncbi:unnamed protein product [Timema podura]|uniref:MOSC domain-containing protein n=1 Tax=Timema podura TaxID=61482 RepID=A0ABN7PDV7_TIMPD|nr:unnamed protein product [Timema podura]
MLMAESSVTDLRSKLPPHLQDITSKRFRPNLVVGGSDPYQEDMWDWVKIGDSAVFKKCKPCTRCVMTTIDPETGVMEPKREPLKTLKTHSSTMHSVIPDPYHSAQQAMDTRFTRREEDCQIN